MKFLVEYSSEEHNNYDTDGIILDLKDYKEFLIKNDDYQTDFLNDGDGLAVSVKY